MRSLGLDARYRREGRYELASKEELAVAYEAVEWRAIFLVAAVLPMGLAMERTGAALLMANTVAQVAGHPRGLRVGGHETVAQLFDPHEPRGNSA